MKVKPMLDDWEVKHIEAISIEQNRPFVEINIPGRSGSVFHDVNTAAASILIHGSLFGDEVRDEFLESIREKYDNGEPVPFVADITTATEIQYVIIEKLVFTENAQNTDQMYYYLQLKESPPPPPSSTLALDEIDAGLLDVAGDFLDSLDAALDIMDGFGSIPDISNPAPQLLSAADSIEQATAGLSDIAGSLEQIFDGT